MLTTPEQACDTLCHKSLAIPGNLTNCVASYCMAWRWADSDKRKLNLLGYCGLAGRPLGLETSEFEV